MTSLETLSRSFLRAMRASGRSPHTIRTYRQCVDRLIAFLGDDLSAATKDNLVAFYSWRAERVSPATVWTDYKVHRVFVRWLLEEEELAYDPMKGLSWPKVPIVPVPVLSDSDLEKLLRACRESRRDTALVMLAIDTGARRGEIAGLRVEDLELDALQARVTGKGKTRIVPFTNRTALALDRYLRRGPSSGSLFGLTPSGLGQVFAKRAREAGLATHLHALRHTFAHRWLAMGGSETDLMTLAGWSPGSRSMLDRYGASARAGRAIEAYRRLTQG